MYSVSEEYAKQINEKRIHKVKGKIFPTNWPSDFEGFDITKDLYEEISRYRQCTENAEVFGIGAVYQGELNFSLKTPLSFTAELYDARVDLQFGLLLESGETEWIPLGVYYVHDIEESGKILKIKALDKMSALDIPTGIIKGQSYTFEESMQKITEKTGVLFAQTFDEINSLVSIELWQYYGDGEPATYRDILRSMAQLFGGFAFINREGKIEFKRLDNVNPVAEIPAKRRYSLILSKRMFEFGKLQYKSDSGVVTTYTFKGNGATVYFENSGFIYSDGTINQLEEIAESLKNVRYYSGTVEYSGNPALDIGDYIQITGGDANGELMLIGSDNWIFRGIQTLISPSEDNNISLLVKGQDGKDGKDGKDGINGTNGTDGADGQDGFSPVVEVSENTDTSYILKITNKNGSFETPNLKGSDGKDSPAVDFVHILCDTSLTGTVIECDFCVVSEESQNICFSGDLVLYSESLQNAEIKYFLDDSEINFTPKISINGYSTQHLSAFFVAETGEHNFKAVIDSDIAEQVQGRIIGQNIKIIEAKPTTADDYVYLIQNNTVKLIYYKGTETRIQIPSEIEGKPVTTIESTCFTNSSVKYAIIPDTVKNIY